MEPNYFVFNLLATLVLRVRVWALRPLFNLMGKAVFISQAASIVHRSFTNTHHSSIPRSWSNKASHDNSKHDQLHRMLGNTKQCISQIFAAMGCIMSAFVLCWFPIRHCDHPWKPQTRPVARYGEAGCDQYIGYPPSALNTCLTQKPVAIECFIWELILQSAESRCLPWRSKLHRGPTLFGIK